MRITSSSTSGGICVACKEFRCVAIMPLFLGLATCFAPLPSLAEYSAMALDPVCGSSDCDEATAQAECEDEASLASSDPGLLVSMPSGFYCNNEIANGHPRFRIVRGNDGGEAGLNEYQNVFYYVLPVFDPYKNNQCE